jgi:hypothetical protein
MRAASEVDGGLPLHHDLDPTRLLDIERARVSLSIAKSGELEAAGPPG